MSRVARMCVGALVGAFVGAIGATSSMASDAYRLTLQPSSRVVVDNSIFAPSTGTLIGNYDATTNPTGTRTLPGIFGGSGNNPIPISLDVNVGEESETSPGGVLTLLANTGAGTFAISELWIDLLNEVVIEAPISATITYSTFRTVSPTFLYPGGIPITIPIGNAQITVLTATLGAGDSVGTLTPNVDGSYTLAGVAWLDVTFDATVLDQPGQGGTFAIAAPIGGTLTPTVDGAMLTLGISLSNSSEIPGPFPAVENVPLDLPTLDPNTPAKVLLTLEFQRIDVTIASEVEGVAAGPRVCLGDFNRDGSADILDFLDFFDAFGGCQLQTSPCPDPLRDADVNSDGLVDILDLLDFMQAFAEGCA
ncbi:MAG: hypothetical protein KF912_05490 [Phycisphaeraceae bacterium]|nr:hypothetical protein [Phycisphaeraceae bacterium]MBX3366751.1 hypothetical protein [Phycisphaeraceae bacterium]